MNVKRKIASLLLSISLLLSVFAMGFALIGNAASDKGEIDVWLIGGQSNAVGYGEYKSGHDLPEAKTDDRYYTGFDNVLYFGEHEIFNSNVTGYTPVTLGMGQKPTRSGAELGIAKALADSGKMNAVIKVAYGATELYPKNNSGICKKVGTWTPPSYYDPITGTGLANEDPNDEYPDVTDAVRNSYIVGGDGVDKYNGEYIVGNLYRQFISVVRESVEELRKMGYTPKLRGMWWMQGEAEAGTDYQAAVYDEMLECLINDTRSEMTEIFGTDQSKMPFMAGNIYRNPTAEDYPKSQLHTVNLAQKTVSEKLTNVSYLHNGHDEEWGTAVDGYTDQPLFGQIDGWHFNAWTQQYFGEKFVEYVLSTSDEYLVNQSNRGDFTFTGSGAYKEGSSVTVSVTPDAGFKIDSVKMSVGGAAATDITASLNNGSYTFTIGEAGVEFEVVTSYIGGDIDTKYGKITAAYGSPTDYPFAVFKNGSFLIGAANWYDTLANLPTAESSDTYTILLRRNYATNYADSNVTTVASSLGAALTLDLGGNVMAREAKYIFDIFHNSAATYATEITVENGTFLGFNDSPLIGLNYGAGSANNASKPFNLTFNKVTFLDVSRTRTTGLVFDCWENAKATSNAGVTVNAVFNDCVFDNSNANAKGKTFISLSGTGDNASDKTKASVTVNGGSFITAKSDFTLVYSTGEDTVKIGKGESGNYPTVTLPSGVAPSYVSYSNTEGKLYGLDVENGLASGDSVVYSFAESGVVCGFGSVAEAYRDAKYKFILFKKDGTNVGYETWVEAITAAKDAVNVSAEKWAGLFLRSDYSTGQDDVVGDKICYINGTLEIDLGSNVLTKGSKTVFDLYSHPASAGTTTELKVYNGTVKGESAIAIDHNKNLTGTKVFKFDFEKVSFVGSAGNNPLAVTVWPNTSNPTGSTTMALTYNGCEFDMSASGTQSIFNLSDVLSGRKSINIAITVNGGTIKNMNASAIAALDSGDSIAFGKYKGSYTTLTIAEGTEPNEVKKNFNDAENTAGRVSLIKTGTADGVDSYTFTASEKAGDLGFIPAYYSDVELYPFVFFRNGEVKDARTTITGYSGYGGSGVYLRKSLEMPAALNPAGINGTFTIDLGGNTITRGAKYILDIVADENNMYDSKVIIKNGTLNSKKGTAIAFNQDKITTKNKNITLEFDNVTFKYDSTTADGNASGTFLNCWGNNDTNTGAPLGGDGYGINASVTYTDCTFDFTTAPSGATMFQFLGNDRNKSFNEIDVIATFNGGTIITSNANAGWKLYNADVSEAKNSPDGSDTGNAVYFNNGSDGKPMKLDVVNENANAQPASTCNLVGTNGTFYFLEDSYAKIDNVKHYYYYLGTALTYEVLDSNGNSLGKHTSWAYAVYAAANATKNGGTATIKLLDNGKVATNGSFATSSGTVYVDLNGYTLSKVSDPYIVNSYYMNTTAVECKVIFKNGTLKKAASANANFGLFCINYANGANQNTEVATLNLEFNNVDFVSERNDNNFIFSLFENGKGTATAKGTYTMAVFNDCSFSYRGTIFNLTGNNGTKSVIDLVINGGEFLPQAGAENKAFFTKDELDSFTFARLEDGRYTTITLPKSAAAPETEYNGLKFKLASETETTKTYVLAPAAVSNVDFTPKASITLDSNLIFNIYLPAIDELVGAALNGSAVALGEAKDGYYLVTVELPSDEAAKEIKLVATLNINGTSVNGSFTFSVVKYAEKLLSMEVTDIEKILVKDMLCYINSAYEYFGGEGVDEIEALLGGYTSSGSITSAEAKKTIPGLSGATFVLDAKPAVRFYFADGYSYSDFTFKVGNRTLTEKDIVGEPNADYVEFSLYAYEMTEDFTYTVDGESGVYNLASYYDYVISEDFVTDYPELAEKQDGLAELVKSFYDYCLSAKAYKG